MSKLTAAIPKDLASKVVNKLTISEIKEVVKSSGLSKIQPFFPEKKKVELEIDPVFPRPPRFPDWENEKKKVEYEVPHDFFNVRDSVTVEELLDQIANEWKKAAIEVDDILDRVTVFENNFFERMSQAMNAKQFP